MKTADSGSPAFCLVLFFFLGLFLLAGLFCCSFFNHTIFVPTPTPLADGYALRLAQARQLWDSQNIRNYHIVYKFYENFARGLLTQRDVVVRNGQLARASCLDDQCPSFSWQEVYTIYDLFSHIETAIRPEDGKCIQGLTFDPQYGFPNYASYHCPDWADDDNNVHVISFEVLK